MSASDGSPPPRVICILNPKSRDGDAQSRWPLFEEKLALAGIEAAVLDITHATLGEDLEALLTSGHVDAIIGLGGDGTHFAAFNVLKDIEIRSPGIELPPYVPVPFGTGNNVAKSLGLGRLRRDTAALPEVILHGRNRRIDLGHFGDRVFADSVGIGMDACVVERRDRMRQALPPSIKPFVHGYFIFGMAGLIGMLRAPRLQCDITVDGRSWYNGPYGNIILNNTSVYGGIFEPCPQCRDDDGALDLIIAANRFAYLTACAFSLRWLPARIRSLKAAQPGGLHFCSIPARNVQITLEPPAPVQVDGEVIGIRQQVAVTVEKQAITIRTLDR